jgi:3'(2'), 5'-bisphosphate nucleotidase
MVFLRRPSGTPMTPTVELLDDVLAIAMQAGALALSHRSGEFASKSDGSPVTAADRACDAFIREALGALSRFPVVSEETATAIPDRVPETFWLVDPLDGTKEFIRGSSEFTVNVALVDGSRAVLGVVCAPAFDVAYYGAASAGSFRRRNGTGEPIRVRAAGARPRVVVSRDHIGASEAALIECMGEVDLTPMGSSLKLCLVAEGAADVYPRYGRTFEWDTAAAQCVLEQAGGFVGTAERREPLLYGKPGLVNPGFIAYGDAAMEQVFAGCC